MARYIDADALYEKAAERYYNAVSEEDRQHVAADIKQMIADAPAVDAVQVVHCGECAIKRSVNVFGNYFVWRCPLRTTDVKPEGFCEYGRKAE